ncbi:MAG: hypothetical protein JSS14_15320 [Proteobacteria bacterium]|nr:hypothetical protein [Pseudomonadota bacterium]
MPKQPPRPSTGNAFTIPSSSCLLNKETRHENPATAQAKKAVVKEKGVIERGRWNGKVG